MYSYCTLFDKNYLDKGLVLIDSFRKYNVHAKIYILAMDEVCYNTLKIIGEKNIIPVKLQEFETEELLKAKESRTRGEYCWTCASNFIMYVFETFQEKYCTYVDADMCFYGNPDVLVEEMVQAKKSVQIIEHRFDRSFAGKYQQRVSGKFCVEFNTFKNDLAGRTVLNTWRLQTLQQCGFSYGTEKLGDQMYLDEWMEKYDCIHILRNLGAGVAPWNINRYRLLKEENDKLWVTFNRQKTPIEVFFYHFHDLAYIDRKHVDIRVHKRFWKVDNKLIETFYKDYLKKMEDKKSWIEQEFGFCPLVKGNAVGVTSNKTRGERIVQLFQGNPYANIRSRMENHIKIFLFSSMDIFTIS